MKRKLQFKKILVVLFLSLFGFFQGYAQGVTFTSINPSTDVVTITNNGSSMVNLTNYWLCLRPGVYDRIGTITPITGDYMLSANESVTLPYDVNESQDGLGLFSTNTFGSDNPTILLSYVQWGAANQFRVGQAVTAGRWDDANNFVSGNAPYTTTTGGSAAAWSACGAEGGAIQITGTTDTTATICVGEGTDDLISVEFVDMNVLSGDNATWVITDQATGAILGTPAMQPAGGFSLEGAPTGICDIWYLRYTGDIGLTTATNVSDLSGCFDLSNPISVTRNAVNGGAIQITGTTDTTATICVGEGTDDLISVEFVDMNVLSGDNATWVITDQATGAILGTPAMQPAGGFSLEGAPTGICDIWYLRYTGDIGLTTATNVSDLSGCFDLSNPISVTRNAVNGGAIQITGTTDTTATICVGEGTDDLISVEFVDMNVLSGDNATWVITDQATGAILGTPAMQPAGGFSLEGAPTGICDIWYLRYTGDIGLTTATNVSDLSGCFDLSNPISVTRNAVNGGAIQITGTTDTTATICVGEGTDDLISVEFVDMNVLSGDNATWVITDQATGAILGTPAMQPAGGFSLEGAPTGICDIWYLRYTGDIGLTTATNVSDLSGCFDLSNPISVTRNAVNGGAIQITGTTDTTATICVGEGTDDLIPVEFVDMNVLSGDNATWVITDQATGAILGTPAMQPAGGFSLEGAPTGICDIWYLRYTGDIGLTTATNVSDLSGCFDLSNPISVTRNAVNGGAIQITGTTDTTATICVGEGVDDLISVEFVDTNVLSGDNATWVITDQATGDILGTPAMQPAGGFSLEGAPTGICDIWYLRYTGDIGLTTATNVSDLSGCFDLSNPISVTRNAVNGGAIQITGTTDTTATICVGEGTDDLIPVEFVDMNVLSGDNATWVITDQATGAILGTPAMQPAGGFSLEGAPTGICDIWYLRYTGDIGLTTATNVSDLSGCFDLSNPISVTRNAVNGGAIQITGTTDTTATICVGEGTDDLISVEFVDMNVLSGDNATWVITDQATGDILGTPAMQPAGGFSLEGAPTGICDIWYLRYTGDIGLTTATNVSDLSGCFDLSNPISVTRNAVNGGAIQITGTTDTTATICVGEGTDDLIPVEFVDMNVLSGDNATWVITDQATGAILGTPATQPAGGFSLEGAPTGICDIWYLRYTGDIGLTTATNVSDLSGCFDLSNPISVTRNAVNGGAIQITGTTDTTATICVGEGTDDLIPVEFVDMNVLSGDNATWVITDQATGDILGTPAMQPAGGFSLEGAPTGICDIWYLRYTGDIGLTTATNVSDLSGCFDLSNPISVTRNAVNGGAIQITGTTDTTATICVGEGTDDLISVEFVDMNVLSGDNATWVITDQATGDILGTPAMQPAGGFSLEGAPTGICDIWYLRYTGDIGLTTATNVSDLSGCFDLSNPISVTRNAVNGGAIQITGTTDTTATICVGEGTDDLIPVEFVDMNVLSGDNATWVITDQATGDILGTPATQPAGGFSLEGAPTGICDIWYLRYTGDIGLTTATNVSDLSGCFDLSNPISVTRNAVNGGAIQITGTTDTTATICVGEGTDDLIPVEFVDMNVLSGDNATWVITDQATGDILGTPAMQPAGGFSLEGAPTGICDIWYLRYTGDIGLTTATNVSDLSGCFDLSNPISVTRNAVNGGAIQITGTTDTTTMICVGEGVDDLIPVEFVDTNVLSGDNATWVITDQATGMILGTPATQPAGGFNLEGAVAGICDIWYLRYTGDIGLTTATNVSDLSGCFDLSNPISVTRLTGTACDALSVEDFDSVFKFNVFPNPAKGTVNINLDNDSRGLTLDIQLIDMLGKRVYKTEFSNQNQMRIDVSNLQNGTYFINITDMESGRNTVKRLIVNN